MEFIKDLTLLAHLTSKLEEVQHNHNYFDSVSDNICAGIPTDLSVPASAIQGISSPGSAELGRV